MPHTCISVHHAVAFLRPTSYHATCHRMLPTLRLAFACHNIVPAAFVSMFGHQQSLGTLMGSLADEFRQSADQQLAEAEAPSMAAASSVFMQQDIPVTKVQGVRAKKGAMWFGRVESATEIMVAVHVSRPVEIITAWLLKTQKQESWLSMDPLERPLVQLVTPELSRTVQSLCVYHDMMHPVAADTPLCAALDGPSACRRI